VTRATTAARAAAAVSAERLQALFHSISEVGAYGRAADGRHGCERLAFSEEAHIAHQLFAEAARETGLTVRRDRIGNTFARLGPADRETAPVLTGSHLDTVAAGGCFDGAAGVVCSLEAVRAVSLAFRESGAALPRPLEVVAWANEEGARFPPAMMGSAVYAGSLPIEAALSATDSEGISVRDALAARAPGEGTQPLLPPASYLELHIEQGVELEAAGVPVAVVDGVQAQLAGDWRMIGREAHAGATPMERRRDALLGAAALITEVSGIAHAHPPGVATVGKSVAFPGSRNTVPGLVEATIDLRHPEERAVRTMAADFIRAGEACAAQCGLSFEFTERWRSPRVTFSPHLVDLCSRAADAAGIPALRLFSAAGHDAVNLAPITPAAMLFVPSTGGVSHHPEEFTEMNALVQGARVLSATLALLLG